MRISTGRVVIVDVGMVGWDGWRMWERGGEGSERWEGQELESRQGWSSLTRERYIAEIRNTTAWDDCQHELEAKFSDSITSGETRARDMLSWNKIVVVDVCQFLASMGMKIGGMYENTSRVWAWHWPEKSEKNIYGSSHQELSVSGFVIGWRQLYWIERRAYSSRCCRPVFNAERTHVGNARYPDARPFALSIFLWKWTGSNCDWTTCDYTILWLGYSSDHVATKVQIEPPIPDSLVLLKYWLSPFRPDTATIALPLAISFSDQLGLLYSTNVRLKAIQIFQVRSISSTTTSVSPIFCLQLPSSR